MVPILWFFGQPILVSAVSTAMAEDIDEQIKANVAPLNAAFVVLVRKEIRELRKEIAAMEFRRDEPPMDDWTTEDATYLVDLRIELSDQEMALIALQDD